MADIPPTSQLPAVSGMPMRDFKQSFQDGLAGVGLSLLVFVLYLLPAPWRPLDETSETRIAVVAREMVRSGDWTIPRAGSEVRLNKPPLPYWLVTLTALVLGPDEESGRPVTEVATVLPSAFFGALCVFMTLLFGAHLFGRTAGVWGGLILGLSLLSVRFSQYGTGEIILMFFTTAALFSAAWLACVPRPGLFNSFFLGATLGMAILTKWHIPVLIVIGAMLIEVVRRRSFNLRKSLLFAAALVVAILVAAPWTMAVADRHPEASQIMWKEIFDAQKAASHDQSDRFVYYFNHLAKALLPWTPILLMAWPVAWMRIRKRKGEGSTPEHAQDKIHSFLLYIFLLGFVALYAVEKQQEYYLLPLLPALALASGHALSRLCHPGGIAEERLAWGQIALGIVAGVVITFSPEWIDILNYGVTIPLGILTILLSLVAARQWVEGQPMIAGVSLGVAAYAVLIGWTLLSTFDAQQNDILTRNSENLKKQIQEYPEETKIYTLRTGEPEPKLLYYLNQSRLIRFQELFKEPLENTLTTPRILICNRKLACEIKGDPESGGGIQLVQITPGYPERMERLKKFERTEEAAEEDNE